ncbi:MAG TPA: hypothetical protein VK764_02955 [Terracidiphilus sp.]|nr:hypothetical protein [Terracidiphilus sp.]
MPHDSVSPTALDFSLQTYRSYASLMQHAPARSGADGRAQPSLGGQLFWAGELDATGRALVVAGNIAGAATLTATGDSDTQRQAVRDGIVDFLVTSLDEALRILKNEIRKHATVAVCVGAALDGVEGEMVERGVRPDLVRKDGIGAADEDERRERAGGLEVEPLRMKALVAWSVEASPALWLPRLDALALDCLEADDAVAQRWLRGAGRYLGKLSRGEHLVWSDRAFASRFIERTLDQVRNGTIKVRGRIQVSVGMACEEHRFGPME